MNRWKVACINWSNRDGAPKAAAYRIGIEGWVNWEKYFPTHAEAITFAQEQATIQALAARFTIPPETPQEPTC